jgi:hypothetical protein
MSQKEPEDKTDLITFNVPALKEGTLREIYVNAKFFGAEVSTQGIF